MQLLMAYRSRRKLCTTCLCKSILRYCTVQNPPIASVPPPAASVQAPPPGLNRAQMEAAMRALSNFPGLPLRPEMLVHAMANKGPPRIVSGHLASPRQVSSPHMPLAGVSALPS